jgi:hypothetical protein
MRASRTIHDITLYEVDGLEEGDVAVDKLIAWHCAKRQATSHTSCT